MFASFFKYLRSRKLLDDFFIFLVLLVYTVGMLFMSARNAKEGFTEIDNDLQEYKELEQIQIEEMKELHHKQICRLERLVREHELKLQDLEHAHKERLEEIEKERERRIEQYKKQFNEDPGEIADEIEEAFGFTFIDPIFE